MTHATAIREAKRIRRTEKVDAWHVPAKGGKNAEGLTVDFVVYAKLPAGGFARIIDPGWTLTTT